MNLSFLHCCPSVSASHALPGLHRPSIPCRSIALNAALGTNWTNRRPKTSHPSSSAANKIPARDRIIDFGKYRGKMLGTLPSDYLRWISKNLRARDFEDWAKLADEVLDDVIYRDRIEWEFAEKVLNGDVSASLSSSSMADQNAVSELLEISQRFGWDNEDKLAWSRIDFGLLGTSKGDRIPRVSEANGGSEGPIRSREEKIGVDGEEAPAEAGKRKQRRDKLRVKRAVSGSKQQRSVDGSMTSAIDRKAGDGGGEEDEDNANEIGAPNGEDVESERTGRSISPFPGRESLIKKAINRRRL